MPTCFLWHVVEILTSEISSNFLTPKSVTDVAIKPHRWKASIFVVLGLTQGYLWLCRSGSEGFKRTKCFLSSWVIWREEPGIKGGKEVKEGMELIKAVIEEYMVYRSNYWIWYENFLLYLYGI